MNTSRLLGRTAAALVGIAAGAAIAHPGHPAVGGPLDHVHESAAAADPLLVGGLMLVESTRAMLLARG